jgi:hypothetical protein
VQPFVSLAAGGGYIRYLIELSNLELTGLRVRDRTRCMDTVAGWLLDRSVRRVVVSLAKAVYLIGWGERLLCVPEYGVQHRPQPRLAYRL